MDENHFSTKDVSDLFSVSHQTVKVWARTFGDFLSPSARPEMGKRRVFTEADLTVFALVQDYTSRGYTFDDAQVALSSGQRGVIPEKAAQIETVPPAALVTKLRADIGALQDALQKAVKEGDEKEGQIRLLRELLDEKEKKIEQLYKENARLAAQVERDEIDT